MSNPNYTVTLGRFFSADTYYQASQIGPFNSRFSDGSFAAYCTFILRGDFQNSAAAMVTQFLWGNLDVVNNRGWALRLLSGSGNTLLLSASLGDGAGNVNEATIPLTGIQGVVTPVERLVMATLLYDGPQQTLLLAVNGVIVDRSEGIADGGASALPARIGAGNAAIAADPAQFVDIVSVGYYNESALIWDSNAIGGFVGDAFTAARETYNSGYRSPNAGADWSHRYAANAETNVSTIIKSVNGAYIGTAPAPVVLADLGGLGVNNPNRATFTPVPLNLVGSADSLLMYGRKNVDWYGGANFLAFQAP